jgi:membrane protein DedA with SNARE-associated domain
MDRHRRWSDLLILIMAFIPNPFFDLAGIAAGTLKMPVLRFYFFCALGSILKMLVFAFGGNTIINLWFKP